MTDIGKQFLNLLICGLICGLISILILGGPEALYAANYQWIQSDWSGGADTINTTGHDPIQNGQTSWNKYYSKDANLDTLSTPGQISLSPLSTFWTQTTDIDFNSGSLSNLHVVGTGNAAYITVNDYVLDLGTGVDGDLVVDGTAASKSTDGQLHNATNPYLINSLKNYSNLTIQNGGAISVAPATILSPPGGVSISSISGTNGIIGNFYYVVTAVDRFGLETPRSPLSDSFSNGIAILTGHVASISWSGVPGAKGYRVYRTDYATPNNYISPSLICYITDPTITSCLDTLPTPQPGSPHLISVAPTPSGTVSPTGGSLSDGTYYYVATAVDYWGFETIPGTERTVTVSAGTNASSVLLTWGAVTGASGYRVYRSTTSGTYNIYDPNAGVICQTSSLSCTDTFATPAPGAPSRSYDNAVANGVLQIKITGNLSVDNTSFINLLGRGFPGGTNSTTSSNGVPGRGPGAGGNRGGGAGYGSAGMTNSNISFPSSIGLPYGDALSAVQYLYPGSGGASGSFITGTGYQGGSGGSGGGAIRVSANNISIAGTLSADGNQGQDVNQNKTDPGGGGSGGLIFIDSNTINNTGQITALGARGGIFIPSAGKSPSYYTTGGSGGNGRIRLSALTTAPGSTSPSAFVGNTGHYESASHDLGVGGAKFSGHNLSWTAQYNGGTLKFLIATNQDNQTWVFRGPDGTPENSANPTYYTVSGTPVWNGHDGDRYIKYKAIFESPDIDPAHSPQLGDVTVGYEYNPSWQSLVSSPYDSTDPTNSIRQLRWDESLLPGTDIGLQMRTAGDASNLLISDWYGPFNTTLQISDVLVGDPGFESCPGLYAAPPSWTWVGATGSGGCDSSQKHSGAWSIRSGQVSEIFYQPVQIFSGVTYIFSVWGKVGISNQHAALLVTSAPAGGGTTYCTNSTASLTFAQVTCQYTPPSDQIVYLTLKAAANTGYYAWFDDSRISVQSTSGLSIISAKDTSGFSVGDLMTITELTNPAQMEVKRIIAVDPVNKQFTLDSPLVYGYTVGSIITNAFTDPMGAQTINAQHRDGSNDQWFQYRIFLLTQNRLNTPVFLENRIGYLPSSAIYQPDGVIDGNGDGVYGAFGSGGGGASVKNTDPGFKNGLALYTVQIQNDGTQASGVDTYTITWNTPSDASGTWAAVLNDGTQDLTSPVTLNLNPGSSQTYTLKVTPSAYAPADSSQAIILNIRSGNEYAKVDSILATANINRIYQADGIIDSNGNDIYDTTGGGNGGAASRTAAPGDTVNFSLTLQNEGNIQDSYKLSQTTSCIDSNSLVKPLPPNWKIMINDGTTDQDITSASWTTPIVPAKINAGSVVNYTLKVLSVGEPVTCNTILKIDSTGTGTTQDSLTATTVLAGTYKVDLWIEGSGDNLYGASGTGAGGSSSKGIPGGTTGSFAINVQNEGNIPDYYELSWKNPSGWYTTIMNQDGSLLCTSSPCLVPPSDKTCLYTTGSQCLAIAGEVIPLRFQVTPPSSFTSGDQSIVIDGKSIGDTTKVDSIRARVWANALNITIASVTSTSATINWTAPSWSANNYDLRYSTKEIIEDGLMPGPGRINFSNAIASRGLSKPKAGGSAESFTVPQLYANTPYYFALKTKQDASYTSVKSTCTPTNCLATTAISTDSTPPSAVNNLAVTTATADAITLCWTAPGDDGGSQPVTGYILNYSTKNIVDDGVTPGMGEVRVSNAALADELGIPRSPGAQECYKVKVSNIVSGNDRTPNTLFFFVLRSEDENHNVSPMSNVAQGLTAMSSNTYNMVSVPKVPNPNTPAAVFGDNVGSPIYLYQWDSRGVGHDQGCYNGLPDQYNPNNVTPACTKITAIQEVKGYFLWSPRQDIVLDAPAGSADVTPTSCTNELNQSFNCYVFPLMEGWNTIGNPFGKEVDVSAIRIRETTQQGLTTTITTVPFLQGVNNNWIGNAIYSYNGTIYSYEFCDNTGCNPVLQPWKSYWVWLHGQGGGGGNTTYDLLIPAP